MINSLGAVFIENVEEAITATHVIASDGEDRLRRTPKLMIAISRTSNILYISWLEQSAKQQMILPTNDFLLVNDKAAESYYDFSMIHSIRNGLSARTHGGVLGGFHVYICSNVAGNKAPTLKELHLIIVAASGTVLESLSSKSIDPRVFGGLTELILQFYN